MATEHSAPNTADYYIGLIKEYQELTGEKVVPPASWNRNLSWWLSWRRRNRDTPNFLIVELQLNELNISCDDGAANLARRTLKPPGTPRGLAVCLEQIDQLVQQGVTPTLSSPDPLQRHLAVWLIRAQAGLLTRRQIPDDLSSPQQLHLKQALRRVSGAQSPFHMAAEWLDFCARLTHCLPKARRADGWAKPIADLQPSRLVSLFPSLPSQRDALLRQSRRAFPTLPSPCTVIATINRILGAFDNPVTLTASRPQTLAFLHALLSAGVPVSYDDFLPISE